jgi:hypothetical protein
VRRPFRPHRLLLAYPTWFRAEFATDLAAHAAQVSPLVALGAE